MKGSLLGWVKTGNGEVTTAGEQAEWSCDTCTFINKPTSTSCNMCLNQRHKSSMSSSDDCVVIDEEKSDERTKGRKRLSTSNMEPDKPSKNRKIEPVSKKTNSTQASITNPLPTPQALRSAGQVKNSANLLQSNSPRTNTLVASSQSQTSTQIGNSEKIPFCKTHKKKCSMKEVRKKGDNLGRWFFSCPVRSCNFFEVKFSFITLAS